VRARRCGLPRRNAYKLCAALASAKTRGYREIGRKTRQHSARGLTGVRTVQLRGRRFHIQPTLLLSVQAHNRRSSYRSGHFRSSGSICLAYGFGAARDVWRNSYSLLHCADSSDKMTWSVRNLILVRKRACCEEELEAQRPNRSNRAADQCTEGRIPPRPPLREPVVPESFSAP
jgi:hypothetical protein